MSNNSCITRFRLLCVSVTICLSITLSKRTSFTRLLFGQGAVGLWYASIRETLFDVYTKSQDSHFVGDFVDLGAVNNPDLCCSYYTPPANALFVHFAFHPFEIGKMRTLQAGAKSGKGVAPFPTHEVCSEVGKGVSILVPTAVESNRTEGRI